MSDFKKMLSASVKKFTLNCLILFLFVQIMHGNDTLFLHDNIKYPLLKCIGFYQDSTDTLSMKSIVLLSKKGGFTPSAKMPLTLVPRKTYWLHFIIKNRTKNSYSWMFNANAPISFLELYTITKHDTLKTIQESVNNYHKIKIACNAMPDIVTDYYIKMFQQSAIDYSIVNCYLSPQNSYIKEFITQSVFTGLILGIMLLIMIYNLFMLMNKRKKVYLIYVIYIIFSIILVIQGSYLVEYVVYPANKFKLTWLYMALSVGDLFYIWFIREFIEPANIPAKIDNYFYKPFFGIVILSNIILGTLAFFDPYNFIALYYLIPVLYALIGLILAALLIIYVRKPESKYALIGNSIAIASGIVALYFDNSVKIENNHIYNAGLLIDIFFFTYALSLKEKREDDIKHQQEMQFSLLKVTLDNKQRELTQKALHVAQQEEILITIKNQLLEIKGEKAPTNEIVLNMLSNVDMYLKLNSWEDFERYFTEVHPEFYNKLKSIYPDLSQTEIRVCAMLKLNLNTKQIADVFRKTPKSIEVTRTRIRQKIGLVRDENLFDKLSQI
jgi:DNA-binding CsgD family transcriptional regulator